MQVLRRGNIDKRGYTEAPQYMCKQRYGGEDVTRNHTTGITVASVDKEAWKKAVEIIKNPDLVRQKVAEWKKKPTPTVDRADIEATIANIQAQIDNLFELARHASKQSTRERLGAELENLEAQQANAEALLITLDENTETDKTLEADIVKFETWADAVRPKLADPTYKPSYEEMRFAVRILGLHAIVYPSHGEHPFRCQVDAFPPEIAKHFKGIVSTTSTQSRLHRQ